MEDSNPTTENAMMTLEEINTLAADMNDDAIDALLDSLTEEELALIENPFAAEEEYEARFGIDYSDD